MGRTERFLIIAALVMALCVPASAQAPKRVALVVANASYAGYAPLPNTTVDAGLVAFLYQSLNEGRRIVLITRHSGDVDRALRRYRLAGLFDAVVRVEAGEEKADHIVEPDAILIDDSYRERRIASQRLGIATFDVDAVELLRDDRV
jgi:FMN phosphatase YigB (HAD superfamily)